MDQNPNKDSKIEKLIQKVASSKDAVGKTYITKYNKDWIIDMICGEALSLVDENFRDYDSRGLDIIDFVKVMLSSLDHTKEETIYLVLALIDLYRSICEQKGIKRYIKFSDLTFYMVEVVLFLF